MNKAIIVVIIVILIALFAGYLIYRGNNSSNISEAPASASSSPAAADTIKLASRGNLGSFLTDADGKTLYYFAKDVSGKSNCTGQCLLAWLSFYAPEITVSSGLDPADFSEITTSVGTKQTTYKGWPLYRYYNDANPGDVNGQGLQNIWFVASYPFYNVLVMNKAGNNYLANIDGMAIYYNKNDTRGSASASPISSCNGQCLNTWPIFDGAQVIAPSLINPNDFSEFNRPDGSAQLSYKGWPLYLYSGDIQSGDSKGDGLNKIWYMAKP